MANEKIALIFIPRSGSTLVCDLFQQAGFKSYYERLFREGEVGIEEWKAETEPSIAKMHLFFLKQNELFDDATRLVRLRRRNILSHALSTTVSRHMNCYYVYENSPHPGLPEGMQKSSSEAAEAEESMLNNPELLERMASMLPRSILFVQGRLRAQQNFITEGGYEVDNLFFEDVLANPSTSLSDLLGYNVSIIIPKAPYRFETLYSELAQRFFENGGFDKVREIRESGGVRNLGPLGPYPPSGEDEN